MHLCCVLAQCHWAAVAAIPMWILCVFIALHAYVRTLRTYLWEDEPFSFFWTCLSLPWPYTSPLPQTYFCLRSQRIFLFTNSKSPPLIILLCSPHHAEYYLHEAKRMKHRADAMVSLKYCISCNSKPQTKVWDKRGTPALLQSQAFLTSEYLAVVESFQKANKLNFIYGYNVLSSAHSVNRLCKQCALVKPGVGTSGKNSLQPVGLE